MINVTKTYLPPLDEYIEQLKKIWETGHVTNNGPILLELESHLREYFGVKHLFLTANGTLALQIAIKVFGLQKKIITTPFSYVATTNSILWENCEPVFVDINLNDFCIDANLIEDAITPEVEAILAVHVYGYPCDVYAIEEIARKHNLRVIYDAAHAFGSCLNGRAVSSFGDLSAMSFHATKLFHTVEGGALITDNDDIARKIRLARAFGHISDEFITQGINAKNSEFHAAMGLCLLPRVPKIIKMRKAATDLYDQLLLELPVTRPEPVTKEVDYNYAYYPVIFRSETELLMAKRKLENSDIFPRRYFYPTLNQLPYLKGEVCPIAENIAKRVLCLPIFYQIDESVQHRVVEVLRNVLE